MYKILYYNVFAISRSKYAEIRKKLSSNVHYYDSDQTVKKLRVHSHNMIDILHVVFGKISFDIIR